MDFHFKESHCQDVLQCIQTTKVETMKKKRCRSGDLGVTGWEVTAPIQPTKEPHHFEADHSA